MNDFTCCYLSVQLHYVSHFIPAEPNKSPVVLRTFSSDHHVRLEIRLPLHAIRRRGRPPFGEVCRGVTFCPHVVSVINFFYKTLSLRKKEFTNCQLYLELK